MLIETAQALSTLGRKSCRLDAQNEIEYAELYGWHTEFIGNLKVSDKARNIYDFSMEKIDRYGKIGSVHQLDELKMGDRNLMILALENDYEIADFVLQ